MRTVDRRGAVVLPELDFAVLAAYASRGDQHEAVVEFRDRLRTGG